MSSVFETMRKIADELAAPSPVDFDADAEDLAEWMGDPDNAEDPETVDWTDSLDRQHLINTLLWRVGNAQRKIDHLTRLADAQKAMVDRWLARRTRALTVRTAEARTTIDWLVRSEHDANPKLRTLELANGTVTWAQPPVASFVVTDQAAAVAWLEATGHAKATRPKPTEVDANAVKGLGEPVPMDRPQGGDPNLEYFRLAVDGEIIPGVHLVRERRGRVRANPA